MKLSLMCARSENDVIGVDNTLPWRIKDDLKLFSQITKRAGFILMGRKTFESLGSKPLPERKNIVLSTTLECEHEDVIVIDSVEEFFVMFDDVDCEVVVIGGDSIYKQFIEIVDTMYISEIDCEIEGDAFFPQFDIDLYEVDTLDCFTADERNEYGFIFNKYTLKQ
jgi:dihydrofolate reductase